MIDLSEYVLHAFIQRYMNWQLVVSAALSALAFQHAAAAQAAAVDTAMLLSHTTTTGCWKGCCFAGVSHDLCCQLLACLNIAHTKNHLSSVL